MGEGVPEPWSSPGESSVSQAAECGFGDGEETGRGGSEGLCGSVRGEEISEVLGSKMVEGFEGEDQDLEGNSVEDREPVELF